MYSDNEMRRLVSYYGQGYDYVIFRDGNSLFLCCSDISLGLSVSTTDAGEFEQIVRALFGDNKTVRVVLYTNEAGEYALPDIDELLASQLADY